VAFGLPDDGPQAHAERYQNKGHLSSDVHQKVIMVAQTNAVVDPGTVMVKSLYALVAHSAVPGSRSPDGFAVRTQLRALDGSDQVSKVYLVLDVTWLRAVD